MEENVLADEECLKLIQYWGMEKTTGWSQKDERDSVNATMYYNVVLDEVNELHEHPLIMKLKRKIELRLHELYGCAFRSWDCYKLWQCFVQKYVPGNNNGRNKTDGAMSSHVDGGPLSGDLASFVYTMWLGE